MNTQLPFPSGFLNQLEVCLCARHKSEGSHSPFFPVWGRERKQAGPPPSQNSTLTPVPAVQFLSPFLASLKRCALFEASWVSVLPMSPLSLELLSTLPCISSTLALDWTCTGICYFYLNTVSPRGVSPLLQGLASAQEALQAGVIMRRLFISILSSALRQTCVIGALSAFYR